jgi:hypothetical protein
MRVGGGRSGDGRCGEHGTYSLSGPLGQRPGRFVLAVVAGGKPTKGELLAALRNVVDGAQVCLPFTLEGLSGEEG